MPRWRVALLSAIGLWACSSSSTNVTASGGVSGDGSAVGGASATGGSDASAGGTSSSNDGSAEVSGEDAFDGALGYRATVLEDAPIGYWRLAEAPPAATTANEVAGGELPGTVLSGVTLGVLGALTSDANSAADFAVVLGGCVKIGVAAKLDFGPASKFTLEAWIKPESEDLTSDPPRHIVGKTGTDGTSAHKGYALVVEGKKAGVRVCNGTSGGCSTLFAPTEIPLSNFTHVVASHDEMNNVYVYIDGKLGNSGKLSTAPEFTSGLFAIGCRMGSNGNPNDSFDGVIDEVAVYDHVLQEPRVAAHFAAK